MHIRAERPHDVAGIRHVNRVAFGADTEADLADVLRLQARPFVSLVAADGENIVGHIVFSPVALSSAPELRIMGLGPMAVHPHRQRRGSAPPWYVPASKNAGDWAVLPSSRSVTRRTTPDLAFIPASRFALACEYDVPDDVFMALELEPGALHGKEGTIRYHPAFANA